MPNRIPKPADRCAPTFDYLEIVELDNDQKWQYIGQPDAYLNGGHLWKCLYSPFATSTWMRREPKDMPSRKSVPSPEEARWETEAKTMASEVIKMFSIDDCGAYEKLVKKFAAFAKSSSRKAGEGMVKEAALEARRSGNYQDNGCCRHVVDNIIESLERGFGEGQETATNPRPTYLN